MHLRWHKCNRKRRVGEALSCTALSPGVSQRGEGPFLEESVQACKAMHSSGTVTINDPGKKVLLEGNRHAVVRKFSILAVQRRSGFEGKR